MDSNVYNIIHFYRSAEHMQQSKLQFPVLFKYSCFFLLAFLSCDEQTSVAESIISCYTCWLSARPLW